MSIFKILKSNQGLSIVEVLMAVGVLGIGALALVNLTQNTAKDTRSVDLNAVKAQYYNSFKEFINSKAGCEELKGKLFTKNDSNISIPSSKLPKIVRDKYFEVKSIQGRRLVDNTLDVDPDTANTAIEVKLTLEVFKNSKKNTTSLSGTGGSGGSSGAGAGSGAGSGVASVSGQEIYYFIIPALVDGSGKVLKCDVERTKDLACRAMGGKIVSGKCKASTNCIVRGSYTVPSSGSRGQHPNQFTGSASCPDPSKPFETGSIDIVYQEAPAPSKKGSTVTLPFEQNIKFYTCLECPGSSLNSGSGGGTIGGGATSGGSFYGGAGFGSGSGSF